LVKKLSYEATAHKYVMVLNSAQPIGVLLNACSHLSIGLGANLSEHAHILPYPAPQFGFVSAISAHPVIVLEAKGSMQLQNLLEKLKATPEIHFNVFASSMLGGSASEQISNTEAMSPENAEFIGIILYGPRANVEVLTKKFSLFKLRSTTEATILK
jgi:hypothetical protein